MKRIADKLFGDDYAWSILAAGRHQMPLVTMGAIMGGNVRVGLEDSLWLGRGQLAESNADQVSRIRTIVENLSLEIATPDEARAAARAEGRRRRRLLGGFAQKAGDAVGAGHALDLALIGDIVQMRQRLAEREGGLVPVELTTEHHRQEIGGAVRPLAGGDRLGAARLGDAPPAVDPRMDAAERQIVRRQYQRVRRQRVAEFAERAQIAGERIALGLVRRHADIGRDLRQDLVAGDQNAGLGAIEAGELRGMALRR